MTTLWMITPHLLATKNPQNLRIMDVVLCAIHTISPGPAVFPDVEVQFAACQLLSVCLWFREDHWETDTPVSWEEASPNYFIRYKIVFFKKSTIKTSSTLNLFPLEQTINTDLSLCRAIIPLSVTFPHNTTSIMYKLSCRFSMEVSLSRQASSM